MSATKINIYVTMLGEFRIVSGEQSITDTANRSQKLWNILSYLIVHRDRKINQSELIDVFWSDDNTLNPVSALKTLLHRIRTMLEPIIGDEINPILSHRGGYSWNSDVECNVDAEIFSDLCVKGKGELSEELAIDCYYKAVDLYKGVFLPNLSGEIWVVSLHAHYHMLYLEAVKILARHLEKSNKYKEAYRVCVAACELDYLDEDIHVLVIKSLINQKKEAAALQHYERATELLYKHLGIRPSNTLQMLYADIMKIEQQVETDLTVVQKSLRVDFTQMGAFVCDYGIFKSIYQLESRRCLRNGTCIHIAMITISLANGKLPSAKILTSSMDELLTVIINCLRQGDVVSKYSKAQYIIMLPSANFEDSTLVLNRLVSSFHYDSYHCILKLSYKIIDMELS